MIGCYSEWNPKLMEVFTPAQLQHLDDVFMYLLYENNIPYQDSMYEAARNNGESPEYFDTPDDAPPVQQYYVLSQIYKKLTIKNFADELPVDFLTNPKYSCNSSNNSI